MTKIKVKNLNEAKQAKLEEVFGHEGPYVEYKIEGDTITLDNEIEATFTKEVNDVEGFDLVKEIKIEVKCPSHDVEFTMEWLEDHGTYKILDWR